MRRRVFISFLAGLPYLAAYPYQWSSSRLSSLPDEALAHLRHLDESSVTDGNSTNCSICQGYPLRASVLPQYEANEDDEFSADLTCAEIDFIAGLLSPEHCPVVQVFFPQCCEGGPFYMCESATRSQILSQIDTAVAPVSAYDELVVVTVDARYQTVESIDVQAGTASIYLTLTLIWQDPRLAWLVGPESCADAVSVRASLDVEKTEIWVPDFDLYNQVQGLNALPDFLADVYWDGTVVWTRSGSLEVICQFSGLAQIPFDVLGCQLLLGPWRPRSHGQIDYRLNNETGLTVGNFPPIYNEFLPVPELFESGRTDHNHTIYFTFYFERARDYYIFNIVIPTIILTYVSFGTFLLDLRVGERLSYGMALTLVVVAQQIVTGDLIPVSDERLWIDKFIGWSFYWVICGLVESVFVGYIFFIREDTSEDERRRSDDATQQSSKDGHPVSQPTAGENLQDGGNEQTTNGIGPAEAQPGTFQESPSDPKVVAIDSNDQQRGGGFLTMRHQLMFRGGVWVPRSLPQWVYKFQLRKIDHFFFFLTTITYTLYVIAMFTSVPGWGRNVDPVYASEDTVQIK